VNGLNFVYQQFIAQAGIQCSSKPKYRAADKHDTPPSHFKHWDNQPCSRP